MIGVVGNSWIMKEPLTPITWGAPREIDADKVENVREALNGDIGMGVYADDTYFGGKQMAALGRLALIADELGETDLAGQYRDNLLKAMESWLNPSTGKLVYDQTWGGIVDQNGINDPGANFGMGFYNDHHFHFGYFVYSAAVLAKAMPDFQQNYGAAILSLIRDYANPALGASDPHFTFMRSKDWYVGKLYIIDSE